MVIDYIEGYIVLIRARHEYTLGSIVMNKIIGDVITIGILKEDAPYAVIREVITCDNTIV